jgi:hypothetical protein
MLYLFLFLVVIATISPAIVGCVIAASTGNPLWLLLWIISFAAIFCGWKAIKEFAAFAEGRS